MYEKKAAGTSLSAAFGTAWVGSAAAGPSLQEQKGHASLGGTDLE